MSTPKHSHTALKLAFILGGLYLLWWLIQRRNAAAVDNTIEAPQPEAPTDNMTQFYASDPNAFNPPSLGTVDINIANQGLGYLSNQFIPLFGFVGMAQGVMFQ